MHRLGKEIMSQQTMQQVIITEPGGVDKLAYETVTVPEPKADEVLVKVHAFGINRPDILQRQGLYPMPKGVTPVPGLEVAGEVVAIGSDVSQFKVGDKVLIEPGVPDNTCEYCREGRYNICPGVDFMATQPNYKGALTQYMTSQKNGHIIFLKVCQH